ncbi:pyruvate kinase [Fastidiosipila sanguinis]|uniref:Pyruvate kinase n=1 Tax=Fastidiosipila sanguinis TaxID=236753 RepID=A0A2S0KN04_9FIRM|nr:pyruvate kinase [Fastidiosipila sanguinis]AVM42387.1 pyruvate kinase [Fastidiosipila sanguinis]
MRKTKIVCTLGPACEAEDKLRQLILNGMNVARFNFSHGDFEEHGGRFKNIKKISEEENKIVATLLDTKGPEIRTGKFKDKKVLLEKGSEVVIRHEDIEGDATQFSCTYKTLHEDVKPGDIIMIDDGLIELDVVAIEGKDVKTVVRNEGPVSTYKGMNLPNINTQLPAMTDKDKADLQFGVEKGYDFVAASFVRKASDVDEIRAFFAEHGDNDIKIISKIENQEGIDNFEEILEASDGIMVARGDLGVEIPPQKVPAYQKYILQRCLEEGKFAITATQMLDSMQDNPRPTRAEVSDVANAVYDGTGATMLSGESANGDYPIESVKMMSLIDEETEADLDYELNFETELRDFEPATVATSVAQAAVMASFNLEADIIVAVTNDVEEVGQISKFRPEAPIVIGFTNARAARQANLHWGVVPVIIEEGDNQIEKVKAAAAEKGLLEAGHLVIELDGCECKGLTSMKVTEYEG